ncbi:MAG: hypothetical protein ACSHX3_15750 [Litorimonas sp.]
MTAGFDADSFWRLTPRLFVQRMMAAKKREDIKQARATEAIWVAHNYDADEVRKYIMDLRGDAPIELPPEALEGALRSATSKHPTMTKAEYLKKFKKGW